MRMMEISIETNQKIDVQHFSMLLEINLKRLLKLKCQNMMVLSKVNITCSSSYLTGEDEDLNET
jgi:hypothetical protein